MTYVTGMNISGVTCCGVLRKYTQSHGEPAMTYVTCVDMMEPVVACSVNTHKVTVYLLSRMLLV